YDLESQGYSEGRSWKSEQPWACISPHWCIKEDGEKYNILLKLSATVCCFLISRPSLPQKSLQCDILRFGD
ncbi:hypothetical protein GBA52_013932, partial [Prunus armeniaca]